MPRIVSVSSLKGGVGKTSIVLGLASAALHGGLKTLVIDLDPMGTLVPDLPRKAGARTLPLSCLPMTPMRSPAL